MAHTEAATFLNAIHDTLDSQSDLSPENPKVNSCLNRLVATLQDWQRCGYGAELADHPEFARLACSLPGLCARAECEMEKWWCRRILASDCRGVQALAAFWYLDNYRSLCHAELDLLAHRSKRRHQPEFGKIDAKQRTSALVHEPCECVSALGHLHAGRFTFLGSGSLPLTAILLAQQSPETEVTCIDCDGDACNMAQELVSLLGLSRQITIENSDACASRPGADETVICASLLDAPGIFGHLGACHVKRVIVRDAEGPYRFCYRPATLPGPEFVERAKSPLSAERINTSRYFEARL